jgi:hypothetical protein
LFIFQKKKNKVEKEIICKGKCIIIGGGGEKFPLITQYLAHSDPISKIIKILFG